MDLSLTILDLDSREVQYSGANNSMYCISANTKKEDAFGDIDIKQFKDETMDPVLYEIKADKMPIGIYHMDRLRSFTNYRFTLEENDWIILFTDGFADQFGGKEGKKLMYKEFKKSLIRCIYTSSNPGKQLTDDFVTWKGGHEQLDDVLVLGFTL
ncbi:MAG: hypothetical protein C0594_08640 [Marinilabiliales bacterium]|nr:MAG: hypothetical protein C0594_08640 [Marinilabiliales bacterium]